MKTLVALSLFCLLQATTLAQTNNTRAINRKDATIKAPATSNGENVISTGGTGLAASTSFIDASVFTATLGDNCTQISQAFTQAAALGLTSVTIDARGLMGSGSGIGTFTCNSNPFSTASSMTGKLLLGQGIWVTTAQWLVPNRFWIDGLGLSVQSSSLPAVNSIVQASSTYSCGSSGITVGGGCPVIFLGGNATNTIFAAGISHLTVDCNNVSSCIGVGAENIQEGAGVDTVAFINQTTACIDFATPNPKGSSIGISNPFIRNVNCTFGSSPSGTANGVVITNASAGPAEISNTTVSVPGGASVIQYCLYYNGGSGTYINYFHCEHASYALVIGDTYSTNGINIHGLTTSNTPVGVWLKNASASSVQGVGMASYSSSVTETAVVDATSGITLAASTTNTPFTLGHYAPETAGLLNPATLIGLNALGSSVSDGTIGYCSNCVSPSNPCSTTSGTGALAVRQNHVWVCK